MSWQKKLYSAKLFVVRSSDIVYQDDLVTAFRDISPQAPTHILIIPNILIPTVNDVSAEHEQALGRMITVAAKIAEQEGIAEDGYRLIMNTNRHGGQEVYHIHMHLLGGRPLGPMLAHKVCNDERMLWAGVSGVVTAGGLSFTSGNSGE